jgi:hypothetical protein
MELYVRASVISPDWSHPCPPSYSSCFSSFCLAAAAFMAIGVGAGVVAYNSIATVFGTGRDTKRYT